MINEITYSDGNVENRIEFLLQNAIDLSSSKNIAESEYQSWPIKYHLSSVRSNCIRHLNFKGLDVLELGAGMGAMSRFVAENCNHLTAVEGTQLRFNCLKSRLRDLHNWDGVVSNYQDFSSDKKYDVVCFFGVLEYAGKYIDNSDPFVWAIKHAKSFLKEDGILLIAIENKNGLKYFSGAGEDHLGHPFHGICGYSEVNSVKTFSKNEMREILRASGFEKVDIHHLSPDYKLTRAVLTDDFLMQEPIVSANILANYSFEDYSKQRKVLFPERLAMVSLAKSGLITDFSNSYLFIASVKKESSTLIGLLDKIYKDKKLGFLYTEGRINEVKTEFIQGKEEIITKKEYLHPSNLIKFDDKIINVFEKGILHNGKELSYLFLNYLYYDNKNEFMTLLKSFILKCFDLYKTSDNNFLDPKSFDAIIRNAILNESGNFIIFDNEYLPSFKISKSYFIFRNVLDIMNFKDYFVNFGFKSFYEFYNHLCKEFELIPNFEIDFETEMNIQNSICKTKIISDVFRSSFFEPINSPLDIVDFSEKSIKLFGKKIFSKRKKNNKRIIKLLGLKFTYKSRRQKNDAK
jgi:cyclopropane fatty-acyl-phospholipid synthase-like methyltransferase